MGAPFSNLRSKLDRAIVAYLQGAGVANSIFPANRSGDIDISDGPVVIVRSHSGVPEASNGGVWRFRVEVGIHASAGPQPADANDQTERISLDGVLAATGDALCMQYDGTGDYQATADQITFAARQSAQLAGATNPDLADFTLQWWGVSGLDGGNPRIDGTSADTNVFKEIMVFEAVCCASNVS